MSQKNEDSMERFFKKGVVQQDKTFMERDWQRMEKMLNDQAMVAASARAGKVRIATRVVIVLSMISFLFLTGIENNVSENTVQMQAAVGALGPRIEGVEVKTENPTADLHSSVNDENVKVNSKNINAKASSEKTMNSNTTNSQNEVKKKLQRTPAQQAKRKPLLPTDPKIISTETNVSLSRSVNESTTVSNGEKSSDQPVSSVPVTELLIENSKPEPAVVSESKKNDAATLEENTADEIEKEADKKSPEKTSYPKFSITGLISPDFSTTSLSRYSKPSGVFGLLLGYRISSRFTVMAGATKSLKRYEGYGQEYSPPEGYWQNRTNGVVPDEVEGQCGIIEIPLMVQFDVLQKLKSRLFVSAGVSSYFMRSEHYDYTFTEPNPGAANSWTAKEPSNYLFKIGHLSAGYDHLIGKKFTIGIEPFLKIPFEGIGWTDINLYSTGAYINLRYNILSIHQY